MRERRSIEKERKDKSETRQGKRGRGEQWRQCKPRDNTEHLQVARAAGGKEGIRGRREKGRGDGWHNSRIDIIESAGLVLGWKSCDRRERREIRRTKEERKRGREEERKRGREAERQRGREAERQRGREAERQRGREAERKRGR